MPAATTFSGVTHWLVRTASMHPERPALVDRGTEITYAELLDRARAAAAGLHERGVRPGDRVALALPTGADFVSGVHGCWFAGAVPMPVDLRLTAEERAARADGAAIVLDRLESGHSGPDPNAALALESVAAVMHTSGTTGAPRRVELTFGNWLSSALGSAVALGLDPAERWLCPMPLVHVGGLSIPVRSAIYGTTAVLHDGFETERVLRALLDPGQRITLVSLVPTMLGRLLEAGLREPPTLRWALLGGGPIPDTLLERAHDAGVSVAPTYGMTEACSQIATHGWPLLGAELSLASDGELIVRGPSVAPGTLSADGWLHTGDLGRFDESGRLVLTGRKSDMIITGGENVAPTEVEAVLLAHPAVADAAVHGRSDPEWGEAVVATVVAREGAAVAEHELRTFCAGRLAPYQVPKAMRFAAELPRTPSGKLLRRQLD